MIPLCIGVGVAGLTGWLSYMIADNEPPYVYDEASSYIIPDPAKEGWQITVRWKIKAVNRYCPGIGHRKLIDLASGSVIVEYDPVPTARDNSVKEGFLTRTFMLPVKFDPSPALVGYRQVSCYQCNLYQQFVRPLCVTTPTLKFRIER